MKRALNFLMTFMVVSWISFVIGALSTHDGAPLSEIFLIALIGSPQINLVSFYMIFTSFIPGVIEAITFGIGHFLFWGSALLYF